MMRVYGRRIKLLREQAGLTQAELARDIGISPAQVCRLENDERPGAQAVQVGLIANRFDASVDYLLGRVDDPHLAKPDDSSAQDNPVQPLEFQSLSSDVQVLWQEVHAAYPPAAFAFLQSAKLQADSWLLYLKQGRVVSEAP